VFRSNGSFRGLFVFFPQKRHSSSNSHAGGRRGLPFAGTEPTPAPPRLPARQIAGAPDSELPRAPPPPRWSVCDARWLSARAGASRTRCRSVRYPLRDTRLPLGKPNVQRCPPCKSQTPDTERNCSRLGCGSAATSSPMITVLPSAAEPDSRGIELVRLAPEARLRPGAARQNSA
jgi:hypothetical protein